MNPVTGEKWGSQSLANDNIPFKKLFGSETGGNYNWSAFEEVKHESLIPAREAAFHYSISVNRFNSAGNSGQSRGTPSSDFIVALGPACSPEGACPGSVKEQAGTFMHELGHNLGLHHGGQIDENYVPNYLSVMNYIFQFSGLSTSPDGVDYSRYESPQIPTLDEFDLNESGGFGVEPPLLAAAQKTEIWCANLNTRMPASLDGPVDFNCNGFPFDGGVSANLHGEAQQPAAYEGEGLLTSYNDWKDLWYRGGAIGGNGLGALLPETTEDDEPSIATLQESSDRLVPPPTGSTGNATGITTTAATLHGEAIPNGEDAHTYFQYGPTTEYGTTTTPVDVGSANTPVATSAEVSGLEPDTTYHYQEIIETPTHLLYGADATFMTQASAGLPPGSTPVPTPTPAIQPPLGSVAVHSAACVVPRLHGKIARKAAQLLKAHHCRLGHTAIARTARHHLHVSLIVVGQSKRPGTRLARGTRVSIVLGAPAPRKHNAKHH
jgi:hypothetical protein